MRKILLAAPLLALAGGCGSSSAPAAAGASSSGGSTARAAWEKPATRAVCGPQDVVEPVLQGQVTLAERFAGFKGTHCNLQLVGQWQGQGAGIQHAAYGHCAYFAQSDSALLVPVPDRVGLQHPGVVAVDVSDPAHPVATDYLNSTSFIDPWESLKVNQKRGLLAAVNGLGGDGGPEFDVYDLTQDCAHPKLLSSAALANSSLKGHEGSWAPDGNTYYGGDVNDNIYYAIDVKDPTAPKLIAQWAPPNGSPPGLATHGLSIGADGNRGYFVQSGNQQLNLLPGATAHDGFYIVDISDVQARRPNPQFKMLATVSWRDGSSAQHTIPVSIQGRPYLIHSDELGGGGIGSTENWAGACAENLPPFGMVRIFDIADETAPRLTARVMLEVDDIANCAQVIGDNTGQLIEGYDTHYCAVDDPAQASILMCSQFASGLRVYDIRDPYHPRELAYYNPPASPGYKPCAAYNFTGICGLADWTTALPAFHKDTGEIWFTSSCNGFQVVKLSGNVWPLK